MPSGVYKKTKAHKLKISKTLTGKPAPWNKGKNHGQWKGNSVGYRALHRWIERIFGKADTCMNPDCDGTCGTFEWVNLDHKYTRKEEDWEMMCRSCHRQYDIDVLGVKFGAASLKQKNVKKKRNKFGQFKS